MAPLLDRAVTILGDIKVFRWPMFVVYDPGSYRVKGPETREAAAKIRPGDILVRGYSNYLDGYLIPGYFSHAALYVGPVPEADRQYVTTPAGRAVFTPGEQMVIHALAEGVLMEDFLNFCRCDYMAVIRFPARLQARPPAVKLDTELAPGETEIYEKLNGGAEVGFDEAFPVVYRLALTQLGVPYDFRFAFTDFKALSCSELVFFVTKCLTPYLGIVPQIKRIAWLQRVVLEPDAFFASPRLTTAWLSPSADPRRVEQLKAAGQAAETRPEPRDAAARAARAPVAVVKPTFQLRGPLAPKRASA